MEEQERNRLRELHHLHCPKCGTTLGQERLEEVAVDICPLCHGIWLDDGELAKLVEGKKRVLASIRNLFS
jgi:Zn-finger nucleic acid-binding protein